LEIGPREWRMIKGLFEIYFYVAIFTMQHERFNYSRTPSSATPNGRPSSGKDVNGKTERS
jgi:hypothetical protein